MNIGERIKNRRIELGMTVDEVAKMLNKNRATVYRYESNDITKLPITILPSLAEVLKTTPADLMGLSEETVTLRPDQSTLLEKYESLNRLGKQKVMDYIQDLAGNEKFVKSTVSQEEKAM